MIATAVRPEWITLPEALRAEIEARLGTPVQDAASQGGGYTHGIAARLVLADGSRAFVKAMGSDDVLAEAYRTEAACAAQLPASVPASRLRFSVEVAGWVALVFDDVAGRHPDLARPEDLAAVLATVDRLADVLTPSPVPGIPAAAESLAPLIACWRGFVADGPPADLDAWSLRNLDRLAELESHCAAAIEGDTLLHADLRPDNLLLTDGGEVLVVDWACTCVGAAWVDLVVLLCSTPRLDAEAIVRSHPITRDVPAAAIDAVVAALAGCWERESREPELATSPQLRAFQARNAVLTRHWLAQRTGWR